jgi:hypothetical protein
MMKVLLALILAVALASASNPAVASDGVHAVSVQNSPRVCRSAKTWGPAPDRFRPCVRITNVEEDGSFGYAVSDADGTVRYTAGVGALDR